VEEAKSLWKKWYWWASHARLEPVKKVAKTMKNYLYGILSYFKPPHNQCNCRGSEFQDLNSSENGLRIQVQESGEPQHSNLLPL